MVLFLEMLNSGFTLFAMNSLHPSPFLDFEFLPSSLYLELGMTHLASVRLGRLAYVRRGVLCIYVSIKACVLISCIYMQFMSKTMSVYSFCLVFFSSLFSLQQQGVEVSLLANWLTGLISLVLYQPDSWVAAKCVFTYSFTLSDTHTVSCTHALILTLSSPDRWGSLSAEDCRGIYQRN